MAFTFTFMIIHPASNRGVLSTSPATSMVTGLVVDDLNGDGNKEIAALVSTGDLYTWDAPPGNCAICDKAQMELY